MPQHVLQVRPGGAAGEELGLQPRAGGHGDDVDQPGGAPVAGPDQPGRIAARHHVLDGQDLGVDGARVVGVETRPYVLAAEPHAAAAHQHPLRLPWARAPGPGVEKRSLWAPT